MSQFISSARLDSYKTVLKLSSDQVVIRAHYWNIAISSAIYPIIHTLEITLRNALDCAVQNYHQPVPTSGKPSYMGNPYWFKLIVTDLQDSKISKMKPAQKGKWVDSAGQRKKSSSSELHIETAIREVIKGKPHYKAHDILSKVPFGFWTTLLSKDYEEITNKHL